MTSSDGLAWGTKWFVPGWESAAPASDAADRLAGAGAAPYVNADVLGSASVEEELGSLVAHGVTALRVPLDWARLEPADGRIDTDALEHLHAALTIARQRGFAIWGCVHDGALPGWFAHDE